MITLKNCGIYLKYIRGEVCKMLQSCISIDKSRVDSGAVVLDEILLQNICCFAKEHKMLLLHFVS